MNFNELNLREPEVKVTTIKLDGDIELAVRAYLPINEKADLITWVLNMSIDEKTGCISPIRLETYFSLAIVKWYAGVQFDIDIDYAHSYDVLELNKIIDKIMDAIPGEEMEFVRELMMDTAADVTRYNNSFMGMMTAMGDNTDSLSEQVKGIVEDIQNAKGLETLSVIKDVVGTD